MLTFRLFQEQDFQEYVRWYEQDLNIQRFLGPFIDEEWLEFVLNAPNQKTHCCFSTEMLVAVAGIYLPDAKHNWYTLSDLAIRPGLSRKGFGKQMLNYLYTLYPLETGQSWKGYVDKDNIIAQAFLQKHQWQCQALSPDENNLLTYTYFPRSEE